MQLAYPPTYLSRVIALPVAVAADALDRVRRAGALDPTVRTDPGEWLSISAPAGTLRLAREDAPDRPARILPIRRVPGRLRTRFPWPTVAVELELSPWSTGRTEVGLRYESAPRTRGLRLYHTIGGEALAQLCQALDARRPPAVATRRRPRVA
ncbi:MAG: hypothetical protein ACRDY6_04565 [Acidimicrobiia bacterium]